MIRELAVDAAQLKLLSDLNKKQGKEICKAFEEQADKWPALIVEHVIETMGSEEKEKNQLKGSVKLLEDLMGDKPQEAVNKAWLVACLGNGPGIAMKEKIRALAKAGKRTDPAPKNALAVTLETAPARLGTITITNRTDRPLRHCVIFTPLWRPTRSGSMPTPSKRSSWENSSCRDLASRTRP